MTSAGDSSAMRDAAHADAASTLWRERELLERLLFALTCQQLVLTAGSVRFLPAADERVREAVDQLTDCELRRAIVTTQLALLLDLAGDATLEQLAARADAPWDVVLDDHRTALRTLAHEIETATAENRRLLQAGADVFAPSSGLSVGAPAVPAYPGLAARRGTSVTTDPLLFDRRA